MAKKQLPCGYAWVDDTVAMVNGTFGAKCLGVDGNVVPVAEAVEDATGTDDIVAQFNALLASLREAGIVKTENAE